MTRYVALFRGINVGKAKRIAMADLRGLMEAMGYTEVRTLLNSGNAVFDSKSGTPASHAKKIRAAVLAELGVDALVVVKSARDIAAAVEGNALAKVATDPARMLVAFVNDDSALAGVQAIAGKDWGEDKLHIGTHAAYLWCAGGILESKAGAALLKGLGETGTTRNWATLGKLQAMM
jgi:uncharacterized protein (DUF1697 family)